MVIALGKQSKLIWPNLAMVIFNVGLNLILIPKISYIGAAIVTVLTEAFILLADWWIMRRHIDLKVNLGGLLKVAFAGIILGLALKYLNFLHLWILILVGGLIYFAALWTIRGIPRDMFSILFKGKKAE
jgi:O-antigen/teichoic acid export membrane protein